MNARKRVARTVAIGVCAALLIVAWYYLAPQQLGGRTTYVTTAGISMEPVLHAGDLVIVREEPRGYQVGDVVAYRNAEVDQVVLHRIVALDSSRFVLKGDANTWIDSYRPVEGELLGEMTLRLPGLGGRIGAVRSPWGMSAMVSVAALATFGGRRRRRAHAAGSPAREDAPASRAREARAPSPQRPTHVPAALPAILAGVAALALAGGAILYSLPVTTTSERDVVFEHRGTFSYSGVVPDSGVAVYGRGTVETGDPVYLALTRTILVDFDYALETEAPLEASGTIGLVVELTDVNGWTRSRDLVAPTAFDGGTATVSGELDLRALRNMTAELERLTGVERDHYTVTVRPTVATEGTLAGRPLERSFGPELRFFLDRLQLQLEPEGASPIGEEVVDPLNPVAGGLLKAEVTSPRTFSLLGTEVGLEPLRTAAAVVLGVALLGLALLGIRRLRSSRRGEPALIEARYGQWLVPVHAGGGASAGKSVQVESFDSLVRLATHYGHIVLHQAGDGFHAYSVEESGVTYRYLVANGSHT
ncbi:MAG: signal peptidase I [Actinomycetota bacterium]